MEVLVEAEVRPTEDLDKVKRAVQRIFDGRLEVVEGADGWLFVRGSAQALRALEPLKNLVLQQMIENAFVSYVRKNFSGLSATIMLHKQAAYVGKISLLDSERESPLGPIKVHIRGIGLEDLVEYFCGSSCS
ncbi:MAG: RNA-binding domain-containing protein [Desulfurococcaceae archaeon]